MNIESLISQVPSETTCDPIDAPDPIGSTDNTAVDSTPVMEAADQAVSQQEFNIDELRAIASHMGVVDIAKITDRETLIKLIRRSI